MANIELFEITFQQLKQILQPFEAALELCEDSQDNYYLNTHHVMKNKKSLFFGAVQIRKNYVSFHLMPVYVNPTLLTALSPGLKKHMQGKSCFNFKKPDQTLFEELNTLTLACFEDYKKQGFIN